MKLASKYNVPGPRYTSYPTVPYWETSPTAEQWLDNLSSEILSARKKAQGAAMYLHIPFCETLCTYCGCNTRITRNHGVSNPYIQTLHKEWQIYRDAFLKRGISDKILLSELHLGGGTPTFLSSEEIRELLEPLLATVERTKDFEFSVEADPRVTTEAHLNVLAELGFKRLSLGIQDFDLKVQETVHRVQSYEQVKTVVDAARAHGFRSINFDLIYGLPFQTLKSVEDTIEKVISLRPDRIAFYAYAHVPWIKPGQRRFTEADLPAGEEKRALYERGRELLQGMGYEEIGMDHFALKTDSLFTAAQSKTLHRNFMGYISRQVSPLIGLGVSAIGDAWTAFAQNEKQLETWQARIEKGELPLLRGHVLTSEDVSLRRHILNLMTRFETSWNSSDSATTPYLKDVSEKLSELSYDGLVELTPTSCKVTPQGVAMLRNICMAFDARLARKAPSTTLFSKTI